MAIDINFCWPPEGKEMWRQRCYLSYDSTLRARLLLPTLIQEPLGAPWRATRKRRSGFHPSVSFVSRDKHSFSLSLPFVCFAKPWQFCGAIVPRKKQLEWKKNGRKQVQRCLTSLSLSLSLSLFLSHSDSYSPALLSNCITLAPCTNWISLVPPEDKSLENEAAREIH